ncbi:hypothetical protein M9H77_31195 [Catharanthus roseus]|uniref:Uncharacterized protein n=1 Tax=Catharanthus roseus TaxID=4058 RepID=A0ACC0A3M9_CATRO|nr:hypothetical protein M9H77_31195 [Catharanthus roseus]
MAKKKAKGVTIADKISASTTNEEKQTHVVHKEQQQPMLHQEAQVVHEEQQKPILLRHLPPTRNHLSTSTERNNSNKRSSEFGTEIPARQAAHVGTSCNLVGNTQANSNK